jgi:1-acyl-sn-glycerol-3-phosphate acyltransferase
MKLLKVIQKLPALAGKVSAAIRKEVQAAKVAYDDFEDVDYALSAGLWVAGVAWGLPTLTALTVLGNQFKVPPDKMQPLYRVYSAIQLGLLGIKLKHHRHPDILPDQPYFFLQNHINHFDFIACHNTSPHYRQGIELASHFKYPLYGPFMKSRGTVAVHPGQGGQSERLREDIRRETDRGRSILGFPEGTRTTDGRVKPFRKGIFFIARDLGVPIVPTAVTGMFEVMRKGSVMLRPGYEVNVYMDAPIEMANLSDEEVLEVMERTYTQIKGYVDAYYAAGKHRQNFLLRRHPQQPADPDAPPQP